MVEGQIAGLQAHAAALEQGVRDLEAQLRQNSSNSSRPPSSDPPQAPQRPRKPPTGRKPGGQPRFQEAQPAVCAAAVNNTDETGWRQANQKRWLGMAATQTAACFKVCVGRGKAALSELLGEAIQGVVCSDRWSAYHSLDLAFRQLCWAHLQRDFQKWLEA
jgi:hypothetical protein